MKKIKGHFWSPSNRSHPSTRQMKWRGAGSFRKAFYKRLKMNRHKKFKICEFDFNFIWEIPLKMKTSKIEKSPSILYENPFKNESDQNSKSRSIFI